MVLVVFQLSQTCVGPDVDATQPFLFLDRLQVPKANEFSSFFKSLSPILTLTLTLTARYV